MKIYFAGHGHDLTEKTRRRFLKKVKLFLLSYFILREGLSRRYKYIVSCKKRKEKYKLKRLKK